MEKRKQLSASDHAEQSLAIANHCIQLPVWSLNYFHLFLPIKKFAEVDTTLLLTLLKERNKQIVLPKVKNTTSLSHVLLTDETKIKVNRWGIPEPIEEILINPKQLEVVFIPLLAYDQFGNRVGYGKGLYDDFLANCLPDVIKVGLSFFDPINQIKEIRKEDVVVDYVVNPQQIHQF
jgi:5-formyltetrahydrofolate cyclo-ligase